MITIMRPSFYPSLFVALAMLLVSSVTVTASIAAIEPLDPSLFPQSEEEWIRYAIEGVETRAKNPRKRHRSLVQRQLTNFEEATAYEGDNVTFEFWSTPNSLILDERFRFVEAVVLRFQDTAGLQFQPKEYVVDGNDLGCRGTGNTKTHCQESCTNNGRYCVAGDFQAQHTTATQVLKESARRMCWWNMFSTVRNDVYMVYIEQVFARGCRRNLTDACIYNAMSRMHMPIPQVKQCLEDAGELGVDIDQEHALLEEALRDSNALKTAMKRTDPIEPAQDFPLIKVEGVHGTIVDDRFDPYRAFAQSICPSFTKGKEPLVCQFCSDFCAIPQVGYEHLGQYDTVNNCVLRLDCGDQRNFTKWHSGQYDGVEAYTNSEAAPNRYQAPTQKPQETAAPENEKKNNNNKGNKSIHAVEQDFDFMMMGMLVGLSFGLLAACYFCLRYYRAQRRIRNYLREQEQAGLASHNQDESEGSFLWPEEFDLDLEPAMQYSDYLGEVSQRGTAPVPARRNTTQAPTKSMFLPQLT